MHQRYRIRTLGYDTAFWCRGASTLLEENNEFMNSWGAYIVRTLWTLWQVDNALRQDRRLLHRILSLISLHRVSPSNTLSKPAATYSGLNWYMCGTIILSNLGQISSHDRRRKQEASRRSLFDRWRLSKSYKIWHPKFQKFPESYLICWQSNKDTFKDAQKKSRCNSWTRTCEPGWSLHSVSSRLSILFSHDW